MRAAEVLIRDARYIAEGSLATGGFGEFGEDSDIDLDVEGLGDQGLYYPHHNDLEMVLLPFRRTIADLETAL